MSEGRDDDSEFNANDTRTKVMQNSTLTFSSESEKAQNLKQSE